MASNSKWKNIQKRKNAQDAKRGKIFMKLAKEIYVAAKEGGADPEANSALRLVIEKAKGANMPNENIDRPLKKLRESKMEAVMKKSPMKATVPSRIAVMVECVTDNKNRTASNVRTAHYDRPH
nr:YebC/PmpR family DNA-binding transcriptional regulator [Bacillus subtilis]